MLGCPPTRFTTSCSQPEDFVNTSTDLFDAPGNRLESARPAPVSVAARRNSLRFVNSLMPFLSLMSFRMFATRKTSQYAFLPPAHLPHSYFRGAIRSADPALQ